MAEPPQPGTQRLVEDFVKRSGGRKLDATTGYAHEAISLVTDALERAASGEAGPLADALAAHEHRDATHGGRRPHVFDANGREPERGPAVAADLRRPARGRLAAVSGRTALVLR